MATKVREAIESSLNETICMELGIMPLTVDGDLVEIGAMNPTFPKLLDYIDKLNDEHGIKAKVIFVDATEWEKWYDQDEQSRFSHLVASFSDSDIKPEEDKASDIQTPINESAIEQEEEFEIEAEDSEGDFSLRIDQEVVKQGR